jgi:ATP-dependent DNA helicase RecG
MENQCIEYKSVWRDDYLKWLCGFANANGGVLYVDKNDKGETVGVEDAKKLLEDLPNKIRTTMGMVADVSLLTEDKVRKLLINQNSDK